MNNVLIIDDDKELCALMRKCVEMANISVLVAHNGLDGLRLADEHKENCVLIILDVMMPDYDGFKVLQKIRETNNVPVLMLTAKSDEEDKISGLRLGADDYLTKPFSINELMARVNSLIRRYTTLNPIAGNEASKVTNSAGLLSFLLLRYACKCIFALASKYTFLSLSPLPNTIHSLASKSMSEIFRLTNSPTLIPVEYNKSIIAKSRKHLQLSRNCSIASSDIVSLTCCFVFIL